MAADGVGQVGLFAARELRDVQANVDGRHRAIEMFDLSGASPGTVVIPGATTSL